ncbi:MAG: M16 family metallopeptidase [Bdellovibrionota bacterium]
MRLRNLAFAALALLPLAGNATTSEKVTETTLPNGLVVHEYKMKNGMQLLLVPDHSAPVFTYQVWFKVGSAAEKMDPRLKKTGLAHFFEHMMFRGTKKVGEGQFDIKLSSAGAVGENASTWFDRTNYFESLPKEKLELAFQLESDRMNNLVINEKGFKNELGAVIGELKMRQDKPASVASEAVWDLAFDKSPYKWTVIGTLDELHSFTVADANYYYHTYYAPNDAALVLIGDFEIGKALDLAEKYYGKYPAKELPVPTFPDEPEQTAKRSRTIAHPLANSDFLSLGYKIPNGKHPDMAPLEMIGAILTSGDGSVLEQQLVQTGIASHVSAGPYRTRYPGLFSVSIQMAPGKDDGVALKALNKELDKIRDGDVTDAEIERARNQYLLSAYNELLDASAIGRNLGESLVTTDNYLREFQLLDELKKVTAKDLSRVAKAYLVDNRLSELRLTPPAGKGASQ